MSTQMESLDGKLAGFNETKLLGTGAIKCDLNAWARANACIESLEITRHKLARLLNLNPEDDQVQNHLNKVCNGSEFITPETISRLVRVSFTTNL